MTFEETCNNQKEKIKAALEGFDLDIDTGRKTPISKERADRIILEAYDEAVYQGIHSMRSGRALEKMLEDRGVNMTTTLLEYLAALDSLEQMGEPYEYEPYEPDSMVLETRRWMET